MKVGDSERVVRVRAALDAAKLEAPDLLIVLVKSFHTRAAIEGARNIVGPDTAVMSLQNGMGHEEILSEVVGAGHVLAGKTYVGGVMLAAGHVIAGTQGKRTVIGEIDGRISERARAIAAEFERAELPCEVSGNILGAMWDKLLINVATGALSGITGQVYGSLYAVPEIEATAIAAVAEAMTVAEAGGVKLSIKAPRDAWVMAAEGLPYEFKTSMLQSLEKGSITEIDFINGAVVRIGRKYDIPTPVNQTLVAAIKGIERRMEAK